MRLVTEMLTQGLIGCELRRRVEKPGCGVVTDGSRERSGSVVQRCQDRHELVTGCDFKE